MSVLVNAAAVAYVQNVHHDTVAVEDHTVVPDPEPVARPPLQLLDVAGEAGRRGGGVR
jgi:hypothetical protein